jgi:hypothetical protein
MMHRPIAEQGLYLKRVMNGFLNYFAVPTNSKAINSFYRHVGWHWRRALRRRGQTSPLTRQPMKRMTDRWLLPARIRHPLPDVRFSVTIQRELGTVVPLAGICARGGEQSLSTATFCFQGVSASRS